jgi:hypothetical protein
MIDIISVFKGLKACIEIILCELQSIQSILEITNEQFPIYEGTIYSLQRSINNLYKIYSYGIPIEHELKFELLHTISIKLKKFSNILKKFSEWDTKIIRPKCLSIEQFFFFLSNPSPSKILAKLEKTFVEIKPLIEDQIFLENKILGTAIRIKHPILQKAWMMIGENQLNDTDIPANIIIENLYAMYLKETNGYIPDKDWVINQITEFINKIDGIASAEPDGKISITEINQYPVTEENSQSVKLMINITERDITNINKNFSEENVHETLSSDKIEHYSIPSEPLYINIPIDFNGPIKINHLGTRIIREPFCVGYGADFNNLISCEFKVKSDLRPAEYYNLFGIDIECNSSDQGFGGTNQCHMRYQINDEKLVKCLQIDRNNFPDNIYRFSIPPENVAIDDTIKLWIFCPAWNGWSMSLNSIKATARFITI